MKSVFQFLFAALLFTSCKSEGNKETLPASAPLQQSVPFYFGLNNNYPLADSMRIQITGPEGKLLMENSGYNPVWGLLKKDSIRVSGRYTYQVSFYTDSNTRNEFSNHFDIKGDEERVDFSINISPFLPAGAEVYVNKYYGNRYNAGLIRNWDVTADSLSNTISPAYQLKNNFDSALFGIYRVQSSTFATHWARLHESAYTQLEKWQDKQWEPLPVNSCVIESNIAKGKTGAPYPDLIYKISKKDLRLPGQYRISLEYGINDAITRLPDSLSKASYPNLYYEMHIYRCYDEFSLR